MRFAAITFWLATPLVAAAAEPITTASLLREMTDLAGLARFPDPPYVCRQFSSYDRASTSPDDHEKWFANQDASQFLRVDERDGREEHVLMDSEGPGAIVRIWSANPQGTLRIYLDEQPEPALEAPMADLLAGKFPGLPAPLGHGASAGWNLYFPIPYAKHCRVTNDRREFYYHINYRTYPAGTPLKTFTRGELETNAAEITRVAQQLADPRGVTSREAAGGPPKLHVMELKPGESMPLRVHEHTPGAIVAMVAKVEAADPTAALRQLLLTIECDGELTVACPLGDFFGAGPGVHPFSGLPLGVTETGEFWSHWVMPYRKDALLGVFNKGTQAATVSLGVVSAPFQWDDRTMHFHAGWRVDRDVPTRPFMDWNYVLLEGRGVYVGSAFAIANPVKSWWGEGDEKIYIDGESFPSHFGTGTEDYYGYAWCNPEPFTNAYHAQPRCDGPQNYGRTAVNRWHILDAIPYERELRFDMELWHWRDKIRVPEMSVTAYWYARPGGKSNRVPPLAADLAVAQIPPYVPERVPGALEGEELQILAQTGIVAAQEIGDPSNDKHLWWREAKPGDQLKLGFPVDQAGSYRVFGRFMKAPDYGIVRLNINGVAVAEPIDFYAKGLTLTPEVLLGVYTLPTGVNTLAVEVIGSNAAAKPAHMFGIDYLRLERTE